MVAKREKNKKEQKTLSLAIRQCVQGASQLVVPLVRLV